MAAMDGISYELTRVRLGDGRETTVYLVRHPRATTSIRVVCFPDPQRLDSWCAEHDQPEAMVAGFFVRDPYRPLGEARIGGRALDHEPIAEPWGPRRACVHIDAGVRLDRGQRRAPRAPEGTEGGEAAEHAHPRGHARPAYPRGHAHPAYPRGRAATRVDLRRGVV